MQCLPFRGEYKQIPKTNNNNNNKKIDEYDTFALATRLHITVEDMKQMSYVSLMNILISSVDTEGGETEATQEDIDRFFG